MAKVLDSSETNSRILDLHSGLKLDSSIFSNNHVSSTRYSLLSLLPKNLFQQLHRAPNIWFLVVSIFELLQFSPTDSWSTILPLIILLGFTLITDAYNDYKRFKADKKINNLKYSVWDGQTFSKKKCHQLEVGDILLLNQGEFVPADIIILAIGGEEPQCYVNLSNIEGLSDLKLREPVQQIQSQMEYADRVEIVLKRFVAKIRLGEPSPDFSKFEAQIQIKGYPKAVKVKKRQVLFRGSEMIGAPWVLGVIVYAGKETKTQLNTKVPQKKKSKIEKTVNFWVLWILLVLVVIICFSMLGYFFLQSSELQNLNVLQVFVTFLVLYNFVIPISLFVSMDLVRVLQVILIQYKMKTVDFKTGDVNQNLGMVEYLLADKTGTLTEGSVHISGFIINGIIYGKKLQCDQSNYGAEMPFKVTEFATEHQVIQIAELKQEIKLSSDPTITHLLRCMSLCNNITKTFDSQYLGTSLVQTALVQKAGELGVSLNFRDKHKCILITESGLQTYYVIGQSNFTHQTRRSRIVVGQQDGSAIMYVQGALDILSPFLKLSQNSQNVDSHCQKFNSIGLRTIIFAYKTLSPSELQSFTSKYQIAKISLVNKKRRIENVFNEIQNELEYLGIAGIDDKVLPETAYCVSSLIQAGIKIWVVSGDSQSSVVAAGVSSGIIGPESSLVHFHNLNNPISCYRALQKAIKNNIYHQIVLDTIRNSVITKRDSLGPENQFFREQDSEDSIFVSGRNQRSTMPQSPNNGLQAMISNLPIVKHLTKDQDGNTKFLTKEFSPSSLSFNISLDKVSFNTALLDNSLKKMLVVLLVSAESVLCYNFLPKDKASLTKLLRKNVSFQPVTLAVGDGNNDIAMIQEAEVGIGISSSDDRQAKYYSEIVISHFSDLLPLLLVHGHWNYSRMSRLVLLFFYKNFVLTAIIFLFFFFSDYSGAEIFDSAIIVGYNLFFTSFPVLVLGVLDQDLRVSEILNNPQSYSEGLQNTKFTKNLLIKYTILSIIQGGCLGLFVFLGGCQLNEEGFTQSFSLIGTSLFVCVVLTVLLQIVVQTYSISWYFILSLLVSVILLLIYIILLSNTSALSEELYGVAYDLAQSSLLILMIFVAPLVCFMLGLAFKFWQFFFNPNIVDKIKTSGLIVEVFNRIQQFSNGLIGIYKTGLSQQANIKNQNYNINKYTLRFDSVFIQRKYRQTVILRNLNIYKIIICLIWLFILAWTFLQLFLLQATFQFTLVRVTISLLFTLILFLVFTNHYRQNFVFYNSFLILVVLICKFVVEMAFIRMGALSQACVTALIYILFNVDFFWISLSIGLSQILLLVQVIYFVFSTEQIVFSLATGWMFGINIMAISIGIAITSAHVGYMLEKAKREQFKLTTQKQISLQKTQSILAFLLPSFVRDRVKEGQKYIAEDKGTVTVIFCDIYDFDNICAQFTPIELTTFLDALFQTFDHLCDASGVTKIETVGKTYMACAGLKDFDQQLEPNLKEVNHPRRAIEFSLLVLQSIKNFKLKNGRDLHVKIGINSGSVTAGVVGFHKPQFSLFGDTVNTASRMCSTVKQYDNIQISERTFKLLEEKNGLAFTQYEVQAKGKGVMKTFYVTQNLIENFSSEIVHQNPSFKIRSVAGSVISGSPAIRDESLVQSDIQDRLDSFKGKSSILMSSLNISKKQLYQNDSLICKVKIIDCTLRQNQVQKQYRTKKMQTNFYMISLTLQISILVFSLLLVTSIIQQFVYSDNTHYLILIGRSLSILLLTLLLIFLNQLYLIRLFSWIVTAILNISLWTVLVHVLFQTDKFQDSIALQVTYIILILNYSSGASVSSLIKASLLISVPWIIVTLTASANITLATNTLFVVGFGVVNIIAVYTRQTQLRQYNNLHQLAQQQIQRTNELLSQMVPAHALQNMREGKATTQKHHQVTLLFADIVGYTNWSQNQTPAVIVERLSEMFTNFDKKCLVNNVYKVHTIGDCYVVMGQTSQKERNPLQECVNVLLMAESMIKIIQEVNQEYGTELDMRIGIHTGDVIAGITGTNIVRYDIYGPDVAIANTMESMGRPGRIHVSHVTKSLLEGKVGEKYHFEYNQSLRVEAVGREYETYFLRLINEE